MVKSTNKQESASESISRSNNLEQEGDQTVKKEIDNKTDEWTLVNCSTDHDYQFTSEKEGDERKSREGSTDLEFALALQTHLAQEEEEWHKDNNTVDVAWDFVLTVLDRHTKLLSSPIGNSLVQPIATDDMYFVVENLLSCQDTFRREGAFSHVSLAYHYTHESCIDGIRQDGLIVNAGRAGFFGKGIYVGNNASAFQSRGSVGLIVAIVKGNCAKAVHRPVRTRRFGAGTERSNHTSSTNNRRINTFIGNKHSTRSLGDKDDIYDEIVLQESCQCVPLIRFDSSVIQSEGGKRSIWSYHREMQRVIDIHLNKFKIPTENIPSEDDIFPDLQRPYTTYYSSPSSLQASSGLMSMPTLSQFYASSSQTTPITLTPIHKKHKPQPPLPPPQPPQQQPIDMAAKYYWEQTKKVPVHQIAPPKTCLKKEALCFAGFSEIEADNPTLKLEVQKLACDLNIKMGGIIASSSISKDIKNVASKPNVGSSNLSLDPNPMGNSGFSSFHNTSHGLPDVNYFKNSNMNVAGVPKKATDLSEPHASS